MRCWAARMRAARRGRRTVSRDSVLQGHEVVGDNIAAVNGQKRKPWMTLLRYGLSTAALLLLFKLVRWEEVVSALRSVAPLGLVLAALLNFATRCVAAGRTYEVSRASALPVSFSRTLQALFISNFWGLALPGVSAGSVATVYRYHRHGAGIMQSLAVLTASRIIELLAFCLLALVGVATSTAAMTALGLGVAPLLLGAIALIGLGILVRRRVLVRTPPVESAAPVPAPAAAPVAASAAASSGSMLQRVCVAAFAALYLLRDLPRTVLARASGWALLQGVLDAATVLVLAWALGIPMGLPQALWINALSYLAILLPISAAGLGMREVAVLAALLPLGVGRADALALALLMLAMTLLNALVGAALQMFSPAVARQAA
jgi:uncharacterized membrane protein YbhN (UPF0104 family)